jgi:hypothetical protein
MGCAPTARPGGQIASPGAAGLMSTNTIISYVFFIAGLVDFVVMPRVLLHVWRRGGPPESTQARVIRMLRYSGLAFIVVGVLFFYRIVTV